jgi:hypothetical protein
MVVHEDDAGIDVVNHIAEALIINHPTCARGVQPSCGVVEVLIILKVCSNVIDQLFKTTLFIE